MRIESVHVHPPVHQTVHPHPHHFSQSNKPIFSEDRRKAESFRKEDKKCTHTRKNGTLFSWHESPEHKHILWNFVCLQIFIFTSQENRNWDGMSAQRKIETVTMWVGSGGRRPKERSTIKKVNLDMDFNFGSTNRIVLRGTCTSHIRRRHLLDMWVWKNRNRAFGWVSEYVAQSSVCARACVLCTDIFSLKFDQTGINHWETFAGTIWCLNGMNLIRTFILDAFCSSIYLFELYFTAQATYHYVSFHFYCCCCCCCLLTLLLYDGNPILFARSHFIFASRTFLLFCRSLCSSPCFNRSHTVPLLRQPSAFGFILFPSIAYDDFNLENWINILLFVTIVHEN